MENEPKSQTKTDLSRAASTEQSRSESREDTHEKTHESKDLVVTMDRLIVAVEKLAEIERKIVKQNRFGPVIIRSIVYALGSTLGFAIVVSLIFYILKSIGLFDSLGPLFNNINDLKTLYTQ